MPRRPAPGALIVAALAACSTPFGGGPRVTVSLEVQTPHTPAPVLVADVGGRRVEVRVGARPRGASVEMRGPRYGDVPVRVVLMGVAGDTLAAVAFVHQLERRSGHWVAARLGRSRPQGSCTGEVAAAPRRGGGTPADTLFVTYGGLPDGAVC